MDRKLPQALVAIVVVFSATIAILLLGQIACPGGEDPIPAGAGYRPGLR